MLNFTSENRVRVIETRELFQTRLASSQASGPYYKLVETDGGTEAPTRYGTNAAPYEPLFSMWTERAWVFQVRTDPVGADRYYDGPGPMFRGPVEFVKLPGLADPIPCPAGQVDALQNWYEESITRYGGVYALYEGWCAYAGSDECCWHRLDRVALFAITKSFSPWDDRDELFTALGKTRAMEEETLESYGLQIRTVPQGIVLHAIREYGDPGIPDDVGALDDPGALAEALRWFQGAAEIRRPDGTVILARGKAIGHNLSQLLVGPGGWLEIHRPDGSVASSTTLDHWTHVIPAEAGKEEK